MQLGEKKNPTPDVCKAHTTKRSYFENANFWPFVLVFSKILKGLCFLINDWAHPNWRVWLQVGGLDSTVRVFKVGFILAFRFWEGQIPILKFLEVQ